jgi:hypothetical protein
MVMVMRPVGVVEAATGMAAAVVEVSSVISRIVPRLAGRVPDKSMEIFRESATSSFAAEIAPD